MNEAIVIDANVFVELFVSEADFRKPLINSTVAANYCVMRCSKCSHMSEYAALSVLL